MYNSGGVLSGRKFVTDYFSFFHISFGYITNGSSFPQPLDKDEEFELIQKSKDGDLDARNKLIERNLRLVAHVIKI